MHHIHVYFYSHYPFLIQCYSCYKCLLPDETFTMNSTQFNIIYPSYLDSTKTISQGRRIGQELAVEAPTVSDISQALQSLNIRHVLQPHKGYSRDIETLWDNPGRVKVDLHSTDSTLKQFESKRELLKEIAQIIPTLPARQQRMELQAQQQALEAQRDEEQKSQQAQKLLLQQQQKATSTKTTNKKKGKKKK